MFAVKYNLFSTLTLYCSALKLLEVVDQKAPMTDDSPGGLSPSFEIAFFGRVNNFTAG